MSARLAFAITLAAVLLLAPAVAAAAPGDPALDARVRETLDLQRAGGSAEEAMFTGSGDLILLAPRKLFTVRLTASPQWTSNAELAPAGGSDDLIVTVDGGVGLATRVADRVNLHAEVGAVMSRYTENNALDYAALAGALGADTAVRTSLGDLTFSAEYRPSLIYTGGFGRKQLTQHRVIGGAQLVTPLPVKGAAGRVLLVTSATADNTWSRPSVYNNRGASIDATLVIAARRDVQVALGGGLYHRAYPDYFPGLIGVKRKDHGWRASASVSWRPKPWLSVTAGYSHVDNRSTSDVNPYRVDSGGLTLRIARLF